MLDKNRTRDGCKKIGVPRSTYLRYVKKKIIKDAPRDGRGWRIFSDSYVKEIKEKLKEKKLLP